MTTTRLPEIRETALTRDLLVAARYYLGGRRGLFVVATVTIGAGLVFNWSWLVAAGIAPILLTALPCVAMCALGLCMNKMAGQSCSTETTASRQVEPTADAPRTAPMQMLETSLDRPVADLVPSADETATIEVKPQSTEERSTTHA